MLRLNLQRFGGRGRSAGGAGGFAAASSDGALMRVKPRAIEGVYREAKGWNSSYYKQEVLEAKTDGHGNLTFSYATPVSREKSAKTNRTQHLTYEVAHGAENGKTFGVNWAKVHSISGQTYGLREEARRAGLKWDSKHKRWTRK